MLAQPTGPSTQSPTNEPGWVGLIRSPMVLPVVLLVLLYALSGSWQGFIAGAFATRFDRAPGTYEYQMLYGIRGDEQKRLAGAGERMRVYVPYGHEWYGYLMRRLAERPSNLTFFLRSLVSQK